MWEFRQNWFSVTSGELYWLSENHFSQQLKTYLSLHFSLDIFLFGVNVCLSTILFYLLFCYNGVWRRYFHFPHQRWFHNTTLGNSTRLNCNIWSLGGLLAKHGTQGRCWVASAHPWQRESDICRAYRYCRQLDKRTGSCWIIKTMDLR